MIYITVGDVGDAAALVPVIRELKKRRVVVRVYADPQGEGKSVLPKNRIAFTSTVGSILKIDPVESSPWGELYGVEPDGLGTLRPQKYGSDCKSEPIWMGRSQPHLLVSGTSGKAQKLHLNAMHEAVRNKIPIIGLEDFYLTSCAKELRRAPYDRLIVMDEDEKRNVLRARKDLKPSQVHALGQPAFDDIPKLRRQRNLIRTKFRKEHAIGRKEKLVVFYGAASYQIDMRETLDPLLKNLPSTVTLIPQFHPADPKGRWWVRYVKNHFKRKPPFTVSTVGSIMKIDPVESSPWGELYGVEPESLGTCRPQKYGSDYKSEPTWEVGEVSTRDALTLSSDLVVSQYNTAAIRSSLLGVPTLFIIFKSVQKYLAKRGLRKPYFPQLNPQHPIALAAFNERDFKRHLATLLYHPARTMRSFARHQPHFRRLTDGRATQRVVRFILKRMRP